MREVLALWKADTGDIKAWIHKHTLAKSFVAASFLILVSLMSLFIFGYFSIFFRGLVYYDIYGLLTAKYIVHAALLVIIWLGVISAIFATLITWGKTSSRQVYLGSLPLKPISVFIYTFAPALISSAVLLMLAAGPIVFAFGLVFSKLPWLYLLGLSTFILGVVTVFSQAIGSTLAVALQKLALKFNQKIVWASLVIFAILSFWGLRILFPSTLKSLYFSAPGEFFTYYVKLPLVQPNLPINWLVDMMLQGISVKAVLLATSGVVALVLAWFWQSRQWVSLRSQLQSRSYLHKPVKTAQYKWLIPLRNKFPLVYKDVLSVIRVRSESVYAFFLLGMVVFFFMVLSMARGSRPFDRIEEVDLVVFANAWLWFFATAYWLRLIFPLMAREGATRWWFLTLPTKRSTLLYNKLLTGLLLSLPMVALIAALAVFWPFGNGREFVWFSLLAFLPLSVLVTALGAIHPNFEESKSAEKISTSGMGLVALGVNGLLTVGWVSLIKLNSPMMLGVGLICIFLLTLGILSLAIKAVSKFSFGIGEPMTVF